MKIQLKCWNNKRLGKQRVEAFQILVALEDKWALEILLKKYPDRKPGSRWINHPAVKMWKGYEEALGVYMDFCIQEWQNRGFKNTMELYPESLVVFPLWFGLEKFHLSHKSNLTRKFPSHYNKFWNVPDNIPYFWPVK